MSTWTTLDLLSTIRARGMFPDASTGSLGTSTLLGFATDALLIQLVPMILSVRNKYYETYTDTTLTSSVTSINLPSRAIGGVLSSVQYINGTAVRQMLPIDPSGITTTTASSPTNYYFENNTIVPYPPPGSGTGSIRMRYFQRPNRLEQTTNCAQVTASDATTVTCASIPTTWAIGNTVDFIPKTQSQATPYAIDQALTGVSTTVLTFTATPSDVAVGDWIALAEYTPIPEIPFEFQSVLALMATCVGLEAIKDQAGLALAKSALDEAIRSAILLMTPRDQTGPKKVVSGWRQF